MFDLNTNLTILRSGCFGIIISIYGVFFLKTVLAKNDSKLPNTITILIENGVKEEALTSKLTKLKEEIERGVVSIKNLQKLQWPLKALRKAYSAQLVHMISQTIDWYMCLSSIGFFLRNGDDLSFVPLIFRLKEIDYEIITSRSSLKIGDYVAIGIDAPDSKCSGQITGFSEDLNNRLYCLAQNGIKSYIDLDSSKYTAFLIDEERSHHLWAFDHGNDSLNKVLLEQSCILNYRSVMHLNNFSMIYAKYGRSYRSMRDIVAKFPARAVNKHFQTAFELALLHNKCPQIIKAIIDVYPEVVSLAFYSNNVFSGNDVSSSGHTPLTYAVATRKEEIIKILINYGKALPGVKNLFGKDAYFYIGSSKKIREILDKCKSELKDPRKIFQRISKRSGQTYRSHRCTLREI